MANVGKYFDRSPNIKPAGIPFTRLPEKTVKDCLTITTLEDKVEALKSDLAVDDGKTTEYPLPRPLFAKRAAKCELAKLLQPAPRSQFEYLLDELKSTTYSSYWKTPLGKSSDKIPNLPRGLDVYNTTFGTPSIKQENVRSLVSPEEKSCEVMFQENLGHELYKKSHSSYCPGEQINRNYCRKSFNKENRFGIRSSADWEGRCAARALRWFTTDELSIVSQCQADFIHQHRPPLGKVLERNQILSTVVPHGHIFGKPLNRGMLGVEELLRSDQAPNLEKRDFHEMLGHLNALRKLLKKRNPPVNFEDLLEVFSHYDNECTDRLPLDTIYKVCKHFRIYPNRECMEQLLRNMNIQTADRCVDYRKFVELINWKIELPEFEKVQDVYRDGFSYETSYPSAVKDNKIKDNANMRVAGIPSVRHDVPFPTLDTIVYREHLGDETDVNTLVSPSVYTQHGVSHRDFFQPRQENEIRSIFNNIGVTLQDDCFRELWEEAYQLDGTGGVCVDTFFNLIKKLQIQ